MKLTVEQIIQEAIHKIEKLPKEERPKAFIFGAVAHDYRISTTISNSPDSALLLKLSDMDLTSYIANNFKRERTGRSV